MDRHRNGFEDLRERTLKLFPDVLTTARRRGADTARRRLEAAQERLRDSPLTVVVCGEFKRGKSRLLNALLEEEPPLFPVDAAVATSLVTVVSHGDTERITVGFAGSDGSLADEEIGRADIEAYATENANPDNERMASMISVETPNTRLAAGLVLVDTPGVGGVFTAHTAATTAFLPGADALVFVSDFTQPLTASELAFLGRAADAARVTGDVDGLIFVITKSDLVGGEERERMIANTVAKLVEVTGQRAEDLLVVPVSSRAKEDFLATGDPDDLTESNFAALERELWPAVSRRRARVVLGAALADLDVGVRALLDPLDAEVSALRAETDAALADLRAQSQARQGELEGLRTGRAEWGMRLRKDVARMQDVLRDELESRLDAVWHRFDVEYLYDPDLLAEPERLVARLGAEAGLVAGTISELAQRRAAEIQRDFAREHGLELQLPRLAELPAPPVPPLDVTGAVHSADTGNRIWDKTRSAVLSSGVGGTVGGTGGAVAGALLGTFAFPGLGTWLGAQLGAGIGYVLGGVGGAAKGVATAAQRHARTELEARRRSIRTELAPLRRSQPRDLKRALATLVDGLSDAVLAELDSRIEQQRESVRDTASRLASATKATRAQADERLAQLDAERAPLVRTRRAVEQLVAGAERLGRRTAPAEADPESPPASHPSPFTDGDDGSWADE
jgi:hypothetical protein